MSVGEWLQEAAARLAVAGIESSRLEAQVLAAHALLVDRGAVLAHPEWDFPDLAGEVLLQRRESGEPLAYILGYREFYGRRFSVRPGVLIPRQETEILVETALAAIDAFPFSPSILDIGVGSGAIAVTLKRERPETTVTAIDVSEEALRIAIDNAESLDADMRLVRSDLFEALQGEQFDLIVSNPPYIGTGETLPTEVYEHEPPAALFSGPTGLEFYERLASETRKHLNPNGRLIVEIGYLQSDTVLRLFDQAGWHVRSAVKDLSGVVRVLEFSR